jgi:4-aminobutyrate aminotransferase-like enzyme
LPPLTISAADLDAGVDILDSVLAEVGAEVHA